MCIGLLAAGLSPLAAQGQSATIREIVVEGAERIEASTVKSYLLLQEGDLFDPARIDRSLKSLFATGLFVDVALQRQGDTLIIKVVENPVINRIAFEGNDVIDDEGLEAEVTLRPRIIYTRSKIQSDVKRILTLYRRRGRFAAQVEPKVIRLAQNRVDVVFEISEGELTEIRSIRFLGNREYSDSRLREVIRTKQSRWWRFLTADDVYDPDRLTLDREVLRRFYLNNGFADFRVLSAVAELTPDRKDFFITFTLEEGARYAFGDIGVEARLRDLQPEQLKGVIEIETGDWYGADVVDKSIDDLTDQIGTLGYAFVDVRPRIKRDREQRTIDVTFEINEGPRVFIERIEIEGNVRTIEEVIRREFKLVEGDAFNSARLRRSRRRIQNLNFFETVNVERLPGSAPDKTVIRVEVEEKSTGQISLGAGFSTDQGPVGDFGFSERNLLGRGQDLSLSARLAARRSEINLSFTEPYFLDREVAAGFDVFRFTQDLQTESSFDQKSTGGAIRAGYPITEHLRQFWKYGLKLQEITELGSQASRFVREQEGKETISEVSHTLVYDRRDSRIDPTDGYFVRVINDLAALGSVQHLRNRLEGGHYFPLADQWVLGLTAETGYIVGIGEDVRLLSRFFIGGDDLRGFANRGVGPRDINSDDALGGEWMYTGTIQLSFPLGLPAELGLKSRVFVDFGSSGGLNASGPEVSDTGSVRMSLGTGVVWSSPVGPIGIDIGIPVLKESFDDTENVRVNFGASF